MEAMRGKDKLKLKGSGSVYLVTRRNIELGPFNPLFILSESNCCYLKPMVMVDMDKSLVKSSKILPL